MTYQVQLMPEAAQALHRFDKPVTHRIVNKLKWLSQNIEHITPESLTGEFRTLYKLRIGSYRVLYTVNRDKHVLVVHLIGHRRDIYRRPKNKF